VTVVLVFIGGALGAPLRYLVDRWVTSRTEQHRFPYGTLLVNVAGCFVLGVVVAGVSRSGWSTSTQALLGTGFCGGLTTFSTFSVETVELFGGKRPPFASLYVVASVVLGISAAALGGALI